MGKGIGRRARRMVSGPPRAAVRPVARWYRYLPTARKMRVRRWLYWPIDAYEGRTGRRDPLTPPRGLRFVGRGDYVATGELFLSYFSELGGLRPGDSVLDVGCGVGRMAVPLARFLSESGRYEGFDAVREAVDWCSATIAARYPAFRFQHVDVANRRYNPGGQVPASTVRFPYPDDTFDFAIITSVFTHLTPDAARRYASETARVLKPGGRLLATFFLLNTESEQLMADGAAELEFRHPCGTARTLVEADPDFAIALPEAEVRAFLLESGLRLDEPIRYGDWCGRGDHLDHQDIVVAVRDP